MFRSALRMFASLCVLTLAIPAVEAAPAVKPASKQSQKKPVTQRKAATPRKSSAVAKPRMNASLDAREKLVKKVVVVNGKRKVSYQRVAFAPVVPAVPPVHTAGDLAGLNLTRDPLALQSNVALVLDQTNFQPLFEKNANVALPIASLTKLMTALIVVEAQQGMEEVLDVTSDDIDREKNSSSRLRVGAQMTRANMLHIALMSSENRAASALGRHFPGGLPAFVNAMNAKAKALGMHNTRFVDSTGLSSNNVASAHDLAKLVIAAHHHPVIRTYSTDPKYVVDTGPHQLHYTNSNRLVMNADWDIGLQKTGYISEAGRCLVMQAKIEGRPVVMVFLDSKGKDSRIADAGRIRKWLEGVGLQMMTQASAKQS